MITFYFGFLDHQKEYSENLFSSIAPSVENSIVALTLDNEFESFSGSGVVFEFERNIYILTNEHVIDNSSDIYVKPYNQKHIKAVVIATDPKLDIAILQPNSPNKLHPVQFGSSKNSKVGEVVFAIGNPLGIGHTVTKGILSAKDKTLDYNELSFEHFLQTDAAINPGNSGGGLFNNRGELIGITTAVLKDSQGLGFAIPINAIKDDFEKMISAGITDKSFLGVIATTSPNGLAITEVFSNSPASLAGLKNGDIIKSINKQTFTDPDAFSEYISSLSVGSSLTINITRNHQELSLKMKTSSKRTTLDNG